MITRLLEVDMPWPRMNSSRAVRPPFQEHRGASKMELDRHRGGPDPTDA